MDKDTNQKIKDELKNNDVCLFMKGTPDVPQCGFSLAIANVLKHLEVKFRGIDVFGKITKFDKGKTEIIFGNFLYFSIHNKLLKLLPKKKVNL